GFCCHLSGANYQDPEVTSTRRDAKNAKCRVSDPAALYLTSICSSVTFAFQTFRVTCVLMEDVAQTKHRLIREAIQENVPRGPHTKIRLRVPEVPRRLWFRYFVTLTVASCFLLAGALYRSNSHAQLLMSSAEKASPIAVEAATAKAPDADIQVPD